MDNGRFLSPRVCALIGFFKLFPAKSLLARDAAKYMTSEGISVRILTAHKDFLHKLIRAVRYFSAGYNRDVFLRKLLNFVFTKTSFFCSLSFGFPFKFVLAR